MERVDDKALQPIAHLERGIIIDFHARDVDAESHQDNVQVPQLQRSRDVKQAAVSLSRIVNAC